MSTKKSVTIIKKTKNSTAVRSLSFPIKPILKWVGGKTQIIDKLMTEFPAEMNNYHEIFVGGGSVLLALLTLRDMNKIKINGNIYAYDLNEPLIHVYKNIQTSSTELMALLRGLIGEFNNCGHCEPNRNPQTHDEATMSRESYYYWTRARYNKLIATEKKSIIGSALFIFLNKTCFRGLFRIGPNGFNTPYGHYKNPEIINESHLTAISVLLRSVIFKSCDFTVALTKINTDDFVYLDPPYAPETSTSFTHYTENGFTISQHTSLFSLCNKLVDNGARIMMNNADVELVRKNFSTAKFTIKPIVCRRAINSKKPDAQAKEVIIIGGG